MKQKLPQNQRKAKHSELNTQRIGNFHYISKLIGNIYHLSMWNKGENSNLCNKVVIWIDNDIESNQLYHKFDHLADTEIRNSNNNSNWIYKGCDIINNSKERKESSSLYGKSENNVDIENRSIYFINKSVSENLEDSYNEATKFQEPP